MEPIEPFIRAEELPATSVLIVHGGPITADKLLEAARREQSVYSWRGSPLACVSTEAVMGGWTLERLLAEHLATRTMYATTTVGRVVDEAPAASADLRRPSLRCGPGKAAMAQVAKLMSILSEPIRNPYRRKSR